MGPGIKGGSWAGERYLGFISVLIVIETMGVDEVIHGQVQSGVMRELEDCQDLYKESS